MKKESAGNIQHLCPECAPKAGSFNEMPLDYFIGKHVKIAFVGINPETKKPSKEHMWVKVLSKKGTSLSGKLDNIPLYEMDIELGDTVDFQKTEIEDVFVSPVRH